MPLCHSCRVDDNRELGILRDPTIGSNNNWHHADKLGLQVLHGAARVLPEIQGNGRPTGGMGAYLQSHESRELFGFACEGVCRFRANSCVDSCQQDSAGMSLGLLKFSGGSVDDYAICRASGAATRPSCWSRARRAAPAGACQHAASSSDTFSARRYTNTRARSGRISHGLRGLSGDPLGTAPRDGAGPRRRPQGPGRGGPRIADLGATDLGPSIAG